MAKSCVLLFCGKTTAVFLMVSDRYFIYLIGPMVMIMSINMLGTRQVVDQKFNFYPYHGSKSGIPQ